MPAAASVAEPASSNKALPEISAMRKAVSPRGTDAVGMPPIKLAKTHSHRTCRWNGRSAPRYAPARRQTVNASLYVARWRHRVHRTGKENLPQTVWADAVLAARDRNSL